MEKYEFSGLIGEGLFLLSLEVMLFINISGTYGSVYKVKNKLNKQQYACKVLRLQDEDEGMY
jgi:serine/threonine protein kinase